MSVIARNNTNVSYEYVWWKKIERGQIFREKGGNRWPLNCIYIYIFKINLQI